MIKLRAVNKHYHIGKNTLHVLKNIELDIGAGELVSVMGSSGSGKSTMLNILGILDKYDSGEYYLGGQLVKNLSHRKAAQFRNQYLGFIFQSFNLISYKNAMENVALPLYYQGISRKKRNDIAMEYLAKVNLDDRASHLPSELSGGQQQRVAIARALIAKPKVILADEPTGALDTETSNEVMDLFRVVNKEGITVVIVTHENDIANQTDRLVRLKDGVIENNSEPIITA